MTEAVLHLSFSGSDSERTKLVFASLPAKTPAGRRLLLTGSPHDALTREQRARALALERVSVVVVDAARGFPTDARREVLLASLFASPAVLLVATGTETTLSDERAFRTLEGEFRSFCDELGLASGTALPFVVETGEGSLDRPRATPWYTGPTLLEALDAVELDASALSQRPFRLLVSEAARPGEASGVVASGRLRPGDSVRVQPSGRVGKVARLSTGGSVLDDAEAGQSVTLELDEAVELSPGDLVVTAQHPAEVADQFEASIVWLAPSPLLRGRSYRMSFGEKTLAATVAPLRHKVKVETLERIAAAKLETGEIGVCHLKLERPVAFEPYRDNRATGGFLLLDASDAVLGVGLLNFALRRAKNVHWQAIDVNRAARARQKQQRPCVLWYTGLSGAGKSTIANLVDKKLFALGRHSYLLDGDNVRHGLNKDLGFTAADRVENIRRIAEVAKLMVDAGLIVSTAFISPFRAERQMARSLLPAGDFIEVFIDTPLTVAESRDPKGLYKKARRGELKNFTGLDSPYEAPENPELRLDTTSVTPEQAAEQVVAFLEARGTFEDS